MKSVLACTAVAAAVIGFSLRSDLGSPAQMWAVLLGGHILLGAYAIFRLHGGGKLRELLAFRRGDPTLGIITGLGMLAGGWLVRNSWIPPGSPEQAWLFNLELRLGDVEGSASLTAGLFAMVLLEEILWRGFVLEELRARWGLRGALPASALLYALAVAPTLVTLRDTEAGPNPLLFLAALGAGLVWGYLTLGSRRLWPALFSHAAFTYFGVTWLLGAGNLSGLLAP